MAHVMMRIVYRLHKCRLKFSGKAEGTAVNGPAADKAADAGNVELEKIFRYRSNRSYGRYWRCGKRYRNKCCR